jgi:predicted TIM-barrel fold metal-dependent hydrolase
MDGVVEIELNEHNHWRAETPGGSEAWARSPYPAARKKYFMVSADTHLGTPPTLIRDRIDERYKHRVARVDRDENGTLWSVMEDRRTGRIVESHLTGDDLYRTRAGSSMTLDSDSYNLDKRMADLDLDGIDAELVFPNGAVILAFLTPDPDMMHAQFRIYNDWAAEISRPYRDRMNIAACIAPGNVDNAIAEVERVAKLGYRVITLPNKPVFGPHMPGQINYNDKSFDPLWARIEETDLTLTFHVSTGADPRVAKGPGGAVVNFAYHCLTSTADPIANLCASGILDRFPHMRFAAIESGIGWVHWFLDSLDEGYRKHHMWAFPKLKHGLPSEYFRMHGGATFSEDRIGLALIEQFGLQDNFCWANDYPHHEGTFPRSAAAIERSMGHLGEETRAKLLGLNAARLFRFDVPANYK